MNREGAELNMAMASGKARSDLDLECKLLCGVCPLLRQERKVFNFPISQASPGEVAQSPKDKPLEKIAGVSGYSGYGTGWRMDR